MTTYLVAHRADPDGILTHAILQRAYNDEPDLRHVHVDYPDMVSSLEGVAMDQPGEVVIADMSLNLSYKPIVRKLSETHQPLTWIDHHQGSVDEHSFLEQQCSRVVVSLQKCAAELAQETHLPKDAYARHLAGIGHAHDFENKSDPQLWGLGVDLQAMIASKYSLDMLVDDLAEGEAWDVRDLFHFNSRYRDIIAEMGIRRTDAYRRLEESIDERLIAGKQIVFAHADSLLYMKDAGLHLREVRHPDYFVISFEGRTNMLFIGKGNVGTSAVEFCTLMGGGGRDNGGGFVLDHPITQATYRRDKERLVGQLIKFLERWEQR